MECTDTALQLAADASLEEPPECLEPYLTRRDGEWYPAVPETAEVPAVGPVEL
ncbi:MAG: hypothetical protein ABEK29_11315 [Bradymonadaceae bacterium]